MGYAGTNNQMHRLHDELCRSEPKLIRIIIVFHLFYIFYCTIKGQLYLYLILKQLAFRLERQQFQVKEEAEKGGKTF